MVSTSLTRQQKVVRSALIGYIMSLVLVSTPKTLPAANTTEVVVIGTMREIVALPPEYNPGHLRLLLAKVNPDVVAVEAPLNATEPLQVAPPEITHIVKPWADERSKTIVAIGWNQEQFTADTASVLQELQTGPQSAKYLAIEQKFQRSRVELPFSAQAINSDGHHQIWREYHRSIHELLGRETPWESWNAKILENLLKVIDQNPGKRVAVVIGAAHAYYLQDALANKPNLQVTRLDSQFPLDEPSVSQATLPGDYLRALLPLNSDLLPPPELKRLEGLLEKLKSFGEFKNDYHLLRGKYLLHVRQPADALKEFEQLGSLDRTALSQVDGKTRLFEAGLVYSALAMLQTGDVEAARTRLKSVLADNKLSESTRNWAQQLSTRFPPGK